MPALRPLLSDRTAGTGIATLLLTPLPLPIPIPPMVMDCPCITPVPLCVYIPACCLLEAVLLEDATAEGVPSAGMGLVEASLMRGSMDEDLAKLEMTPSPSSSLLLRLLSLVEEGLSGDAEEREDALLAVGTPPVRVTLPCDASWVWR